MKTPVTDEAVNEYATRLRSGGPLGEVFPGPMSECDFTPAQREVIRRARADKKAALKKAQPKPAPPVLTKPKPVAKPMPNRASTSSSSSKSLTKLRKLLYLQSNRCFFCREQLPETDASIEHLTPKARGGSNADGNLVACHKSLNQVFGDMDLKSKFEFVMKSAGKFTCP